MKIPPDEIVATVIKKLLKENYIIGSQEQLLEKTLKALKEIDKEYAITGERLRAIAITIPEVRIDVETKRSGTPEYIKNCPNCATGLKNIFGINLYGEKIVIGFICERCGYSGTPESNKPYKYTFRWMKKDRFCEKSSKISKRKI